MAQISQLTGREYHLFNYYGAPDAERVIVAMGSVVRLRAGGREVPERPGREGGLPAGTPVPPLLRQAPAGRHAQDREEASPCWTA